MVFFAVRRDWLLVKTFTASCMPAAMFVLPNQGFGTNGCHRVAHIGVVRRKLLFDRTGLRAVQAKSEVAAVANQSDLTLNRQRCHFIQKHPTAVLSAAQRLKCAFGGKK